MQSSDYGELPTSPSHLGYDEIDDDFPSTQDLYPPPSEPPVPFSEIAADAFEAIELVKQEAIEKKVKEGKVILFETRWPNHGNEEELKVIETPTRPRRSTRSITPPRAKQDLQEELMSTPTAKPRQEEPEEDSTTPQQTPKLKRKLKIELTTSPFPSSPPTPLLSNPRPNQRLTEQLMNSPLSIKRGPKRKPPDGLKEVKELPEFADDMKVQPSRKRVKESRVGDGEVATPLAG